MRLLRVHQIFFLPKIFSKKNLYLKKNFFSKIFFQKKKSHSRNFALLRLASTDTNVYYAHVRDAAADLQPPRRHEQRVSSKKIYALYCNANLRLASTDTGVYYAHPRRWWGSATPRAVCEFNKNL